MWAPGGWWTRCRWGVSESLSEKGWEKRHRAPEASIWDSGRSLGEMVRKEGAQDPGGALGKDLESRSEKKRGDLTEGSRDSKKGWEKEA